MTTVLLCWIGQADYRASKGSVKDGHGAIGQTLLDRKFDEVHLLHNEPTPEAKEYSHWLTEKTMVSPKLHFIELDSPMNYERVYLGVLHVIQKVIHDREEQVDLTFHLSPGTSAMSAVWIILGKTQFPAKFLNTSKEQGTIDAIVPFEIAVDYVPHLMRDREQAVTRHSVGLPIENPSFDKIIGRSEPIKALIARASKAALYDVPVLIEGESGTGKELLAQAIHHASRRRKQVFKAINCGAIPESLIESELFGYNKGAFTGASSDKKGLFESAHEGTVFLDEIGELPLNAQVRLLRVLQEQEITRVGATTPIKINVRIIAATHRNLQNEIEKGNFREDLFYRIAMLVLRSPPLRDRPGDLALLIEHFLTSISRDHKEPNKKLSVGARNLLSRHYWPGNVRELEGTLMRAFVWASGNTITETDVASALFSSRKSGQSDILNRAIGGGFQINSVIKEVITHYLERAMTEAKDNKTQAAKLLGINNYQTLSNWLGKYKGK